MNIVHEKNGVLIEQIKDSVFIVRGYADGKSFPDQFDWVMIAVVDGLTVMLKGFIHAPERESTFGQARQVRRYFKSIGIKKIIYERFKNKQRYEVEVKL